MPVKTWHWPSSRRTWCTQELGVARYTVDGDLGSGSLMLVIRIHIPATGTWIATVLVVVLILLASGVIFPMGLVFLVVVVVLLAFSAVIVGRVRGGVVGGVVGGVTWWTSSRWTAASIPVAAASVIVTAATVTPIRWSRMRVSRRGAVVVGRSTSLSSSTWCRRRGVSTSVGVASM